MVNGEQNIMHQKLRKTKLCSFLQEGRCLRGEYCAYAHSQVEQICQPDLSKTLICLLWKAGKCKHTPESCRFAHGKRNLRDAPEPKQGHDNGSGLAPLGKSPMKIQLSDLSSLLAPMAFDCDFKEVNISMAPLTVLTQDMKVSKPPWVSMPCTFRQPSVGDRVKSLVGEVTLEDAHGNEGAWKLALGEFAVVSAVDGDGDFRLRNVHGLDSCFSYRKDYAYVGEAAKVAGNDETKALARMSAQTMRGAGYWSWSSHWEECNTIESSTESTEPGGTVSGNASEDDCSSLGSPLPGSVSPRAVTPPPGLCLPDWLEPPPGLCSPITSMTPPGLCFPVEVENSGSDADASEDGMTS